MEQLADGRLRLTAREWNRDRTWEVYQSASGGGWDAWKLLSPVSAHARQAEAGTRRPDFSPSNLWPEDRSWIVYTDYDLWETKIVGPAALINALVGDTEIEAVRLPWGLLRERQRPAVRGNSAAHSDGACGVPVSGAGCEVALGCRVSRCPVRTVPGPRRWCPR
ncbi:hypothetical protein [Streptomyces olivoreticuli]|uniref:hypothetical protein n=1 Tax=Streptomyces olivoreticuli TaxID=68246 RepID=UPI000E27BE29|nr:hypothetical protein [Streptomyces olivoreticuli]